MGFRLLSDTLRSIVALRLELLLERRMLLRDIFEREVLPRDTPVIRSARSLAEDSQDMTGSLRGFRSAEDVGMQTIMTPAVCSAIL